MKLGRGKSIDSPKFEIYFPPFNETLIAFDWLFRKQEFPVQIIGKGFQTYHLLINLLRSQYMRELISLKSQRAITIGEILTHGAYTLENQ